MERSIYDLELHDEMTVFGGQWRCVEVTRVPGGWIYETHLTGEAELLSTVFVPFDNEFQKKVKS